MSYPILRTRPIGRTYGRALPIFIHNGSYYLAELQVYADGVFDCWGLYDHDFFLRKLQEGWVATAPPAGAQISIHGLGGGTVASARWDHSPDDLRRLAEQALDQLNPGRRDLVDFGGEDTELRGKLRYAKLGLADAKPYRALPDGNEVLGDSAPMLLPTRSGYRLTRWFVYADGMAQLGLDTPYLPFEETVALAYQGQVRTRVPAGAAISIDGMGVVRIQRGHWGIQLADRIAELRDMILQLNGDPGAVQRCREAFAAYQASPAPARREQLRQAYEAVPQHLRLYCGDMDDKDGLIRRAIYGKRTPRNEVG